MPSQYGIERAEYILCFERDSFGDRRDGILDGKGREERLLPWVFIRLDGNAEERYVMPIDKVPIMERTDAQVAQTEDCIGNRPWQRMYVEYMQNRPFPLEAFRPSTSNTSGDANIAGPVAVQYFGGV